MTSEIGKELTVAELVPRTVYVLSRSATPEQAGDTVPATMWFVGADTLFAAFFSGITRTNLILFVQPDGSLRDDAGPMHVFEYLGDV